MTFRKGKSMFRHLLACSLVCSLCFGHIFGDDVAAFIVMNAKNGKVLAEKAAYEKMSPASTTKIATVSYVLGTPDLDLDQKVAVPLEALKSVSDFEKTQDNFSRYPSYVLEKSSSIAGLKKGEVLTIRDLLFANMVVSGGDAANTLAYYWGDRSIETFMDRLNRFVESLGCKNTHFKNPNGLHHPDHLSCAYDLALIARFAMQNPTFRAIVSCASYTKPRTNKQPKVIWQQTNKLVTPKSPYFYEAATGIKTGYHSRAQRCVVASAENGERSLIAVALRCPERRDQFSVPKRLLEQFLTEKKKDRTIIEEGPIQLKRELEGHRSNLSLRATSGFSLSFYPSEEPSIRSVVEWENLSFPIQKGQKMGLVHIFADDEKVAKIPVVSEESRKATWKQRFLEIQHFLGEHKGAVLIIAILLCLLFCYFRRSRSYF
jgi:D-alanyl-D-alanine carboxypeptidase (penicillin-binding protein 5/6)